MYLKTAYKPKFKKVTLKSLNEKSLVHTGERNNPTLYFTASYRPWKSYESYICVRAMLVSKFITFSLSVKLI